jgi:hypothetical protein
MFVVLEIPEHLEAEINPSLCMTARFECGGAIIRYVLTYGDDGSEHEFYDYDDMIDLGYTDKCEGCGMRSPRWSDVCCRKCSACGAYENNECKEDCSYQAKKKEEDDEYIKYMEELEKRREEDKLKYCNDMGLDKRVLERKFEKCCENCSSTENVEKYWWIENENKKWLLCEKCGIEEEQEKVVM